jgi:2-keto-4-pentenoate hydratase
MGFGPFYGPLFSSSVQQDGATVALSSLGSFKAAEAEFCFVLGTDLTPPASGGQFTEADVWAAVSHVVPAIELAASRLAPDVAATPAAVLGDCTFNGAVILGTTRVAAQEVLGGHAGLANARAALVVDSVEVGAATGAAVLGNPLTALTWLANALATQGHGLHLRKGDIVMSGAAVAYKAVGPGQRLEATFGGIAAGEQPLRVGMTLA